MSDWTNKLVAFKKDLRKADTIRPETFTADQEWCLCRHVVTEAASTVKTEGSSANDYPLYHIKCHVKRKNGYYLWNIAMIIVRKLSMECMKNLLNYLAPVKVFSCVFSLFKDSFLILTLILFSLLFQFLIDLLSFCSFSVEISSPSDRLSVTLTLLLTAVAFKFVVSQSLPTISYLTLLVSWFSLAFSCDISY